MSIILIYSCEQKSLSTKYFEKGKMYYLNSKYDSAIYNLNKSINLDSSFSEPHFYLASSFYMIANYDATLSELNKLSTKSYSIDSINKLYTKVYLEKGDFDKSIYYADKLINNNSGYYYGYSAKATNYYNKANIIENNDKVKDLNYVEALKNINIAIKLSPTILSNYVVRGVIKFGLSDYDGALKDFNKALRTNIRDKFYKSQAYRFIGCIYEKRNNFKVAESYLDSAIICFPDEGWNYITRGRIKVNYNIDDACFDFRKALDLDETDAMEFIQIYCDN